MKDLGPLGYFLGIEVAHSPKGYLLPRSKQISDVLEQARLADNKIADASIEVNAKFTPSDGMPLPDRTLYRTIVGCSVYLTITLLDIACFSYCQSVCGISYDSSLGSGSSHPLISSRYNLSESYIILCLFLGAVHIL